MAPRRRCTATLGAHAPATRLPEADSPGDGRAGRQARPESGDHPLRSKAALTAAIHEGGRTVLVVNTRSRKGRRHCPRLPARLAAAGVPVQATFPVDDPSRLHQVLTEALALDPDLLVFGGGDGSLTAAAGRLAYHDTALGVLPLGTTNNLARSLGLPLDLPGAITTLADGKVADVDLARAGGDLFANMASIGLSVQVAQATPASLKRLLGRAAYTLTALRHLPAHRPFKATLTTDSTQRVLWTHQLNIANGAYHTGRRITRDASVDDRLLVVYGLGDASRLHLTGQTLGQVLAGPRRWRADQRYLSTRELRVATDPPLPLDLDGEVCGTTPVGITLLPQALRVLVPSTFVDT
jgi:YegS/Rv2252/BmrU family lipid kinase